jgi:hypothetical protein
MIVSTSILISLRVFDEYTQYFFMMLYLYLLRYINVLLTKKTSHWSVCVCVLLLVCTHTIKKLVWSVVCMWTCVSQKPTADCLHG